MYECVSIYTYVYLCMCVRVHVMFVLNFIRDTNELDRLRW